MIVTQSTRAPTNDERRAQWAARYYLTGQHRIPRKPRILVKPRVRILPGQK